jgi:Reverse transcriptase (RNA-dependent DNA polymerase)/Endonuclease-reverse transcriptase
MNKLNFMQANVHSTKKNKDTLIGFLHLLNIDAALLSETFSAEKFKIKIPGYNYINVARSDNYGGAGIMLRDNLAFSIIDTPREHDIQLCIVKVQRLELYIASVYITPNASEVIVKNYLRNELEKLKNKKVVFAGDFNAHDPLWGGQQTNKIGNVVLEIIRDCRLSLLNDGTATYNNKRGENSAIDLTFVSKNLQNVAESWKVEKDSINDEHFIITFSLTDQNTSSTFRPIITQDKKGICNELSELHVDENTPLKESLEKITAIINSHTHMRRSSRTAKLWWNDELKSSFEEFRLAMRAANKNPTPKNISHFIEIKNKWNKIRLEAKKKNAHEKISKLTSRVTTKELWDVANSIEGKKFSKPKSNFVMESNEQSEKFMEKIFLSPNNNDLNNNDDPNNNDLNNNDDPNNNDEFCDILTVEKFDEILKKKKERSAAGSDNISYFFLKSMSTSLKINFVNELNRVFEVGKVPQFLKQAKVIPIPKPQKDLCMLESYRPITLQNTAIKILGSAVLEKTEEFLLRNKIIPETSFGFQSHKSTISCTNFMRTWTTQKKAEGKNVVWIFLDMSGAFDCVNIEKLVTAMKEINFPKKIIRYFQSAFTARKITLTNNEGKLFTRITSNSLPQGASESPMLFNVYTAGLHKLSTENFAIAQLADDFTLMFAASNNRNLQQLTNGKLRAFVGELKKLHFEINAQKTSAQLYNFKSDKYTPQIEIDNHRIAFDSSTKVLGTIFDSSQQFRKQHEAIIQKIDQRCNVIKRLAGTKLCSHPSPLLTIYRAAIRSVVDYDAAIYGNGLKKHDNEVQRKLTSIQRLILGVPRTTPLNIVSALACEPPNFIRRQNLIAQQTMRESVTNSQSHKIWQKKWKVITQKYDEKLQKNVNPTFECFIEKNKFLASIEKVVVNEHKAKTLNIDMRLCDAIGKKEDASPTVMKALAMESIRKLPENSTQIYTDASKNGNDCGFGFLCPSTGHEERHKLENYASICSAELLAIKHALIYANEKKNHPSNHSDRFTLLMSSHTAPAQEKSVARNHSRYHKSVGENERKHLLDPITRWHRW